MEIPSWRLHRLIYRKLSSEVEGFAIWTPGLVERIDSIIDKEYGEHDLGRGRDPESFERLLVALFIEFGDIYDGLNQEFLKTDREQRIQWINKLKDLYLRDPLRYEELNQRYLFYIPDDVIVIATLHHILDLCMGFLYKTPIGEEESNLMLEYASREA